MEFMSYPIIVTCLMVIVFLVFNIFEYLSLRRFLRGPIHARKVDDKFILENIVYTRTGLRGIYSGLFIVAAILTILGFKAVDDIKGKVSDSVTAQIKTASQVDLQHIRGLAENIDSAWNHSREQAEEIDGILKKAQSNFNNVSAHIDDKISEKLTPVAQHEQTLMVLQTRMNSFLVKHQPLLDSLQKWNDRGQIVLAAPSR